LDKRPVNSLIPTSYDQPRKLHYRKSTYLDGASQNRIENY